MAANGGFKFAPTRGNGGFNKPTYLPADKDVVRKRSTSRNRKKKE